MLLIDNCGMSYVYIYALVSCLVPLIIDGSDVPVAYSSLIPLSATPLINVFTSHPGYDGHVRYPDGNYTQDWYITTDWINHTIKIHFATCFIENSKGSCLFDYLYVYDGANSSSPELMKSCCGRTHSATLESSTGEMYILFETDNTVGDTGFEIEYWSNGITTTTMTTTTMTTPTTTTPVAQSTVFYNSSLITLTATPQIQLFTSHPDYDGHTQYPDGNYRQDWYITTNWINHTIKLNFATCFIENSKGICMYDYLYVYDGANSSSPELLRTCCGETHSATLESSSGEMYILFETDYTVGDIGFEIEYWSNGITTTGASHTAGYVFLLDYITLLRRFFFSDVNMTKENYQAYSRLSKYY